MSCNTTTNTVLFTSASNRTSTSTGRATDSSVASRRCIDVTIHRAVFVLFAASKRTTSIRSAYYSALYWSHWASRCVTRNRKKPNTDIDPSTWILEWTYTPPIKILPVVHDLPKGKKSKEACKGANTDELMSSCHAATLQRSYFLQKITKKMKLTSEKSKQHPEPSAI